MAREIIAVVMSNVNIMDQIWYQKKNDAKTLKLEKYGIINLYLHYCFSHFPFPSKKASAGILADSFDSLSISDLYLAHTLHHIFTTYLVQ